MIYDLIIIGLGPAGISAGIYAKRSGLNVLCFEAGMPGGLMNLTMEISNYPGIDSISGPDLAMQMFNHFKDVDVPYKNAKVVKIEEDKEYKKVVTKNEEFLTKKIIIATGRSARKLGKENEVELTGKGISYCAICDANLYKGKDIAVVGAGNSALEEAIYLASIVNKVYIIHRRDELRGDQILVDKINELDNIEIIYNTQIESINKSDKGVLKNLTLDNGNDLDVACLFIYVGFEPALDFTGDLIDTNPSGYIIVNDNYETNCPGIYAVGDIIAQKYYQIVTAAGQGAIAALNVNAAIKRENNK